MSAHTPGPWHVAELTKKFGVYDAQGTNIAKVDGAYGVSIERRKADAFLIAASPALYEALEFVVATYGGEDEMLAGDEWFSKDERRQIVAALKAARGEK